MSVFGGLLFRSVPAGGTGLGPPGQVAKELRAPRRSPGQNTRNWIARAAMSKPLALLAAVACTAGLVGLASVARHAQLESPLIEELPPRRSGRAEPPRKGFAPGIVSPTDILAIGPGWPRRPRR